jgi:hypothetical protein
MQTPDPVGIPETQTPLREVDLFKFQFLWVLPFGAIEPAPENSHGHLRTFFCLLPTILAIS